MFTIDLLKGTGRPPKSTPAGLALYIAPFVIPVLILLIMIVNLIFNRTALAATKSRIDKTQTMISEYQPDLDSADRITNQVNHNISILSDVAKALKWRIQFSGIISEIVRSMPDEIILDRLELNSELTKQKSPDTKNPSQSVLADSIRRTLNINVINLSSNQADQAVQSYISRLKTSANLAKFLEQIRVSACRDIEINGKNVPCYEIDCVFKPQM